jgi:hypothetical protein
MSSLQSLWLCREFTEHDATPLPAEMPLGLLVMKGSPVRIRASALPEAPHLGAVAQSSP